MIPHPRQIGDGAHHGGGGGSPIPGKSGMGPLSLSPDKSGMGTGMHTAAGDGGSRALRLPIRATSRFKATKRLPCSVIQLTQIHTQLCTGGKSHHEPEAS